MNQGTSQMDEKMGQIIVMDIQLPTAAGGIMCYKDKHD